MLINWKTKVCITTGYYLNDNRYIYLVLEFKRLDCFLAFYVICAYQDL